MSAPIQSRKRSRITRQKLRFAALGTGIVVLLAAAGSLVESRVPEAPSHPALANMGRLRQGSAPSAALQPRRPATDLESLAVVREVVSQGSDEHAKTLLSILDKERGSYDEIAQAYDELNRRYQDDFVRHASGEKLRSEGVELDALMRDLRNASDEIQSVSAQLSDVIVAQSIADNRLRSVSGTVRP